MDAPILWVCKKHQHVGESSSEDEFMALIHAYKAVKWIRNLFEEIGLGHSHGYLLFFLTPRQNTKTSKRRVGPYFRRGPLSPRKAW